MRVPSTQELQSILAALSQAGMPQANPGMQGLLQLIADSRVQLQPYSFVLTFTNVTAGQTPAPGTILVDTSAPFMLISQQYLSTAYPVAAQTIGLTQVPNINVQIQDQQSNRFWQSAGVPVSSIFGDARQPYYLPQPRMIAANSNLQVTITNFDAAQAYNLYLTFTGYRYYAA